MRTYYYARVSTAGQNLDRQLDAFHKLGATEADIITDKASGKDTDRVGYQYLKQTVLHSGDTLVVKSLDRLSRSKADIKTELEYFKANGIRVKVLDIPTTMMDFPTGQEWVFDMVNNILIEVLGSIAQQERLTTKQRQAEGIAAMKTVGGKKVSHRTNNPIGRPTKALPKNWDSILTRLNSGEITATQAAKEAGMARTTFYKTLNCMRET